VSFEEAIARQLGRRRFTEFKNALEEINEHIASGDLQIAPHSKASPASNQTHRQRAAAAATGSTR
jgi:hypothetical protein